MGKAAKKWFVIATAFVVVGLTMFTVVMLEYGWDFNKLSTENFKTNTYKINKVFYNISMNTDTADIIFAVSHNGTCWVECYEAETAKHSVTVQEDTLVIKKVDKNAWYDHIGISFDSPKITVYLPKAEYASLFIHGSTGDIEIPEDFKLKGANISLSTGDVRFLTSASELIKIKTSTGNICVENAGTGVLDLSTSTGAIIVSNVMCGTDANIQTSTGRTNLTHIACKNLSSTGSTGNIFLNHVIATEGLSINRTTGDVRFDGADATEIMVETDTGDVKGALFTDKIFIVQTSTGSIDIPKTMTGGKCEITTDTGDIKITIE